MSEHPKKRDRMIHFLQMQKKTPVLPWGTCLPQAGRKRGKYDEANCPKKRIGI
jgi:hypothetical protein